MEEAISVGGLVERRFQSAQIDIQFKEKWLEKLKQLKELKIPRCIRPTEDEKFDMEIHV